MPLRILIFGDIVGTPGRQAVTQAIPRLRETHRPHLVLANVENCASGSGLTPELYKKLCNAGIDGMTLGDHTYRKKQIIGTLEREANIIRPANISAKAAGKRTMRLTVDLGDDAPPAGPQRVDVMVFTLMGRLFNTSMPSSDPFACADELLAQMEVGNPPPTVIAEVHAEATSEKVALGWYLNGKVAAVFGTHTHVQTNDARILPQHVEDGGLPRTPPGVGGTAYITDLGMSGPADSVLGRRIDRVVYHMSTNLPAPFDVATGQPEARGIYLEIDPASRRTTKIQTLVVPADVSAPPFAQG